MANYNTLGKYGLRGLLGTSLGSEIDDGIRALRDDVAANMAGYAEGTFALLPAAGTAGRIYRATDNGKVYLDTGTTWLELTTSSSPASGKSIIAATETLTSTTYSLMTTPDRVQGIVVPTDGLLEIAYMAIWRESVSGSASAAIFIGANQLKRAPGASNVSTVPVVQEISFNPGGGVANTDVVLVTNPVGLISEDDPTAASYAGHVTTGQVIGIGGSYQSGGVCSVHVAPGAYDISVRFKSASGTVTVKDRRLWVRARSF